MDGFSQYIKDILRYPLLNKQQEILLARQVQAWLANDAPTPQQVRAGKRAYEKLINCNLRLVVSIAKRYTPRARRTELFDIVQEGNIGLAQGVKKFDPERGYAMSTYVYWWIRQAITRHLSHHDRMIRLPSHAVEMLAKLRNWTPQFYAAHGRKPSLEECADYCGTNVRRMKDYLERADDCLSLDMTVQNCDTDAVLLDSVSDGEHPMDKLDVIMCGDEVDKLLAQLDDTDRFILEQVYAVNGGEPKTYLKVSKELGISRERARQRCHRALTRLRLLANQTSAVY